MLFRIDPFYINIRSIDSRVDRRSAVHDNILQIKQSALLSLIPPFQLLLNEDMQGFELLELLLTSPIAPQNMNCELVVSISTEYILWIKECF